VQEEKYGVQEEAAQHQFAILTRPTLDNFDPITNTTITRPIDRRVRVKSYISCKKKSYMYDNEMNISEV